MKILTKAEAKGDVLNAYLWHAEEEERWGEELLDEFQRIVGILLRFPRSAPNKFQTYREAVLSTYPYILIFEHAREKDMLIIYSLFHTRRDPSGKF